MTTSLTHFIKTEAAKLGFSNCGIAKAEFLSEQSALLHQWLKQKYHGEMSYMERDVEKRLDPRLLFPQAKTVVCFLINYYPGVGSIYPPTLPYPEISRPLAVDSRHAPVTTPAFADTSAGKHHSPSTSEQYPVQSYLHPNTCINIRQTEDGISLSKEGQPPVFSIQYPALRISIYALGKDYHLVVKDKLERLLKKIKEKDNRVNGCAFVDSAPIMEKVWAMKSGLGWIGKNTLLITKHGSFFFIGEILLDIELKEDASPTISYSVTNNSNNQLTETKGYCGRCTRCIDACPTGALIAPYVLDAKRCISYLTIEAKTPTLSKVKSKISNNQYSIINNQYPAASSQKPITSQWLFGCDICQLVCPWNRFAKPSNEYAFEPNPVLLNMTINDWKNLTQKMFERLFKNSPLKRAGYEKIQKNLQFIMTLLHR